MQGWKIRSPVLTVIAKGTSNKGLWIRGDVVMFLHWFSVLCV